jgi:RNA polymerase sigma factor (sigma-70 family)
MVNLNENFSEDFKRLEVVYHEFFPIVYSVAKRFFPDDAEEVTAEFFIRKVFKPDQVERFLNAENPKGLLITSIKNFCLSRLKYQQRKAKVYDLETITSSEILDYPCPRIEFSIDFKNALESLPEMQKMVFSMSAEGYSGEEIARKMNTTVGAVEQLKYRARKSLKKFLS